MDDSRKVVLQVTCPTDVFEGDVLMVAGTWTHICERHIETRIDDIAHTLQFPLAIHQDAKKQNSVLIVGSAMLSGTQNPLRVSVKTGLPDGNFVQTAFYSSDPINTHQVWPGSKEGKDE